MNDLLKRLDTLLKPVNDAVKAIAPAQLIRYVTIYMLVAGIAALCAGITIGTVGLFGGGVAIVANQSGQAASELAKASAGATIYGILSIIAGPIMLIVAFGLYRRMGWARMGVVIALLISVISSLIGLLSRGDILNIVWILGGLYLAYFFYTDAGIKREFGQA